MSAPTKTAAAADGTAKSFVEDTRMFRALVATIVAATLMLTGFTAAQARVVNDILDGNGPRHPSIRQLERQPEVVEPQHPSIRQLERQGQTDDGQRHPSIRQVERAQQLRADELARMEYNELRRFRNRAPAAALATLDEAIAQLATALA